MKIDDMEVIFLINNVKLFLVKYRRIMKFILVIILTILIINFIQSKSVYFDQDIIKSFIGAIIGGYFAVYGSKVSSNNEFKKKEELNLREKVYIPLYNEHISNYKSYMENKSFYPYIILEHKEQKGGFPLYSEWESINKDYRYLIIPKKIEQLEKEIREITKEYFKQCNNIKDNQNIDEFIFEVINKIVDEELDMEINITNLGLTIMGMITKEKEYYLDNYSLVEDFYVIEKNQDTTFSLDIKPKIDSKIELEVKEKIYDELHSYNEIQSLIKVSKSWIEKTVEILDYLEFKIKKIHYKNR